MTTVSVRCKMAPIRIESLGSYWWINLDEEWYIRTPKEEKPRWNPRHAGIGTSLEDLKRFPFRKIALVPIDKKNYWSMKYNTDVVGVVRFWYNGQPRYTALGEGPWVHAPLTRRMYAEAEVLLADE